MEAIRKRVLIELDKLKIPVILIGAQAVRALGSSRETYDVDFAARAIDIDRIIDLMYEFGFRLPTAAPDIGRIRWAQTAAAAKRFVENEKSGALNFYLLDASGEVVDQIDFVIENPVPFACLKRDAGIIGESPHLASASVDHLIAMKEKRIADGKGRITDEVDLVFLREHKRKR